MSDYEHKKQTLKLLEEELQLLEDIRNDKYENDSK